MLPRSSGKLSGTLPSHRPRHHQLSPCHPSSFLLAGHRVPVLVLLKPCCNPTHPKGESYHMASQAAMSTRWSHGEQPAASHLLQPQVPDGHVGDGACRLQVGEYILGLCRQPACRKLCCAAGSGTQARTKSNVYLGFCKTLGTKDPASLHAQSAGRWVYSC